MPDAGGIGQTTIGEIANAASKDLSEDFAALYPPRLGRPSIPPERLRYAHPTDKPNRAGLMAGE